MAMTGRGLRRAWLGSVRWSSSAADWEFPLRTVFGPGRLAELPELLSAGGATRPLLVTDAGLAETPMVTGLMDKLEAAGLGPVLFSDVQANPTDLNINAGAQLLQETGRDAVVALGGGSGLDAGKSIAMVAGTGLSLTELEWTREPACVGAGRMPLVVTVPTTAGTGAEMNAASMYTDTSERVKYCVTHPDCQPIALCDPLLTVSLPRHLTAWTGLDALTHAIEALCVDMYHPMCDGIAVQSVLMIDQWLVRACNNPNDVQARTEMLAASSMAAVAFQKGLGAVHGLSEPTGAVHDTQHGLTNAVLLPYVLRANRSAIEPKMSQLAAQLGLAQPGFEALLDWLDKLLAELEIPATLGEIGVDESTAGELAEKAARNPTGYTNPIEYGPEQYEVCRRLGRV